MGERADGNSSQTSAPQRQWRTRDFIVAAALAVPIGLIWSFVWEPIWRPAVALLPEAGQFFAGFYIVAAVLSGYVIRKPGAALLGEMLGAIVEIPFIGAGPTLFWVAFLEGLGPEVAFMATRYRRFDLPVLLVGGALGGLFVLVGYSYVAQSWWNLAIGVQALRIAFKLAGGAVFAGLVAKIIGDALVQTGVLNNFPVARARQRPI
jgi:energy-coupling factor transport system substrate-specific component